MYVVPCIIKLVAHRVRIVLSLLEIRHFKPKEKLHTVESSGIPDSDGVSITPISTVIILAPNGAFII